MILVFCMAGLNSRFHDVGFDVPKYLLPWGESVILDAILSNLPAKTNFSKIILLPNERDKYFKDDLMGVVSHHGINDADVVFIPDTRGQAHTAAIATQLIKTKSPSNNEPIFFHNADTILKGRNWQSIKDGMKSHDAFVDIFPASDSNYSYVTLEGSRVTKIVEKMVISPFASSGFYGFKSAEYYLKAFNSLDKSKAEDASHQTYLSDVIQNLIDSSASVFTNDLNRSTSTIVLGSPHEYGLELARQSLSK